MSHACCICSRDVARHWTDLWSKDAVAEFGHEPERESQTLRWLGACCHEVVTWAKGRGLSPDERGINLLRWAYDMGFNAAVAQRVTFQDEQVKEAHHHLDRLGMEAKPCLNDRLAALCDEVGECEPFDPSKRAARTEGELRQREVEHIDATCAWQPF